MLNSKFKFFKVDSEKEYPWYEKEKLPKPVIYVELRHVQIDRNHVENFEWQLRMSKHLQELHLTTNVQYLRLAGLSHLRLVEVDLGHPTNVLSIMSCPNILQLEVKNLVIIDTSAHRVINLHYLINKSLIYESKPSNLEN